MKKKLLLLILCIVIIPVGCSKSSSKSKKINADIDTIKLNDEYSDLISSEFGIYFITTTMHFVEWYNIYVTDSNDEQLKIIRDSLDNIILGEMYQITSNSAYNEHESKIYDKVLKTGMEITDLHLVNEKLQKEHELREKNLKELTDGELEQLEKDKESKIVIIKGYITDILDTYFIYE